MDTAQPKVVSITLNNYHEDIQVVEQKHTVFQIRYHDSFVKMGYGQGKVECKDSYSLVDESYVASRLLYYLVYDGHGSNGKEASQASNDYVQTHYEKHHKQWMSIKNLGGAKKLFSDVFNDSQKKLVSSGMDYSMSGTCALIVLALENHCYIANLGHSKAVLYRKVNDQLLGIELTQDHRPSRKDESDRIQAKGGIIQGKLVDGIPTGEPRVYIPELKHEMKVTRSFGDFEAKKIGVTHEPEITDIKLSDQDEFIVLASDGVWDVMSTVEVGEFILKNIDSDHIAEELVKQARLNWEEKNNHLSEENLRLRRLDYNQYCDDISAIVGKVRSYNN